MVKDSLKVGYTEHLLYSSSWYKNKGLLVNHDGGKFKRTGSSLQEDLLEASLLFPLNMTPIYFMSVSWGIHLSLESKITFMSHYTPLSLSKNASVIIALCFGFKISSSQMLASRVSCLTMFKGKFESNHYLWPVSFILCQSESTLVHCVT